MLSARSVPAGRPHLGRVDAARRDEHLAVAERGHGRVPAPAQHVRAEAPEVRHWIEDVRLDDAVELLVLVAAGHEHPAVGQMREAAAEDVEAGVDVDRRLCARRRIPHRRARVVLHGVRLGRVVADRVVGEYLAVGQQRDVDADHRPVDDRAPTRRRPAGHRAWAPLPVRRVWRPRACGRRALVPAEV